MEWSCDMIGYKLTDLTSIQNFLTSASTVAYDKDELANFTG